MKNITESLCYFILSVTLIMAFCAKDVICSELLSSLVIITCVKIISLNQSIPNK